MKRIRIEVTVIAVKESEVRKGTYYVTADSNGWGTVKYVTHSKRKVGDVVVLQDQWNRIQADKIRWEEVR